MTFKKTALLLLITLIITLLSVSFFIDHEPPTSNNQITSYVLYAQDQEGDTIALLRTIQPSLNMNCPIPLIDNISTNKVVMQARQNPAPSDFPITVCEAIYPKDAQLYLNDKALIKPSYQSEHIAVLGDSGCKSSKQTCTLNSDNWFFNALANNAAKDSPEVVLHMGDYNYSGTPGSVHLLGQKDKVQVYDAGDNTTQGMCKIPGPYYGQNSQGSEFKDSWKHWQQDFFNPAQNLLSSAPWVFARGNHELCSRAGPGWFYLLDSNSPLLGKYQKQLSCPAANNSSPMIFSQPYGLNLGKANILVLDSTNACDSGLLNLEQYQNQFLLGKQMLQTLPAGFNILQTHRPMFGIDELAKVGSCGNPQKGEHCSMSQTLQQANALTGLTDEIKLIISGHMHRFQSTHFAENILPDQLVVGTSGVSLAGNFPTKPAKLKVEKNNAYVNGISQYAYLKLDLPTGTVSEEMETEKVKWHASLINPQAETLLVCQPGRAQLCKAP